MSYTKFFYDLTLDGYSEQEAIRIVESYRKDNEKQLSKPVKNED